MAGPLLSLVPTDCRVAVQILLKGGRPNIPNDEENVFFKVEDVPSSLTSFLEAEEIPLYKGVAWAGGSLVRTLNGLDHPAGSDIDLWVHDEVALRRLLCHFYSIAPESRFYLRDSLIIVEREGHSQVQLIYSSVGPLTIVDQFDGDHLKAYFNLGTQKLVFSRAYCRAWMTKCTRVENRGLENYARRVHKARAMGFEVEDIGKLQITAEQCEEYPKLTLYKKVPFLDLLAELPPPAGTVTSLLKPYNEEFPFSEDCLPPVTKTAPKAKSITETLPTIGDDGEEDEPVVVPTKKSVLRTPASRGGDLPPLVVPTKRLAAKKISCCKALPKTSADD